MFQTDLFLIGCAYLCRLICKRTRQWSN